MRHVFAIRALFCCIFILCAQAAVPCLAGEAEAEASTPELPYAVRKAEERFGSDIDKAQAEYSKAIKSAADDYVKVLEREKDRATRAANLELALYLKQKIESTQTVAAAEQILPPTEAGGGSDQGPEIDFTSEEGYDAFRGKEFRVDARAESSVLFTAARGKRYQVFVHPTDTWQGNAAGEACSPLEGLRAMPGNMLLMYQVGDADAVRVTQGGVIEGEGRVSMFANDPGKFDNVGSVRLKVRLVP